MTMPATVIGPAPGATLGLGCRNQIWEWGIRVYKINRAQTQFHIFAFESGSSGISGRPDARLLLSQSSLISY